MQAVMVAAAPIVHVLQAPGLPRVVDSDRYVGKVVQHKLTCGHTDMSIRTNIRMSGD